MTNDTEAKRRILNRLRRANGQLTAIIAAVEGGASCRDVVTQLSAVSSALDRAGFAIISTAMRDCLTEEEAAERGLGGGGNDDRMTAAELEKLFLMLA